MYLGKGFYALLVILLLFTVQPARAEGPTVLTVVLHDNSQTDLDIAALEAMEPITLRTRTPWSEGVQTFTGVPISRLLTSLGAQGRNVEARALNNYKTELSWDELARYPVIIAYKRNGNYMRIRDKGPLWIIYPLDDYPELRSLDTDSKMIWQLRRLTVR
ncbi:molybdopterin-dependent oxidoreductase [Zobellella maritima]|uniref:molybdopterin-dependent oxidoreductase n=1 Tax=Zobellella maritima TaxID=2059725 RepID=UPI0013005991|nr:molybdopterin-dependent oxidoreductase [Zobellella maritima]